MLVTRFSSRANLNTFEFTVILVVGATGYLGGIITRSLLQQSHAVRITLRPNSNHSDLIGLGAKAAHADLKDPDSLPAACKGIDVVITTANSARRSGSDNVAAVDLNGNRNLINAAREAGVRQFIFISAYEADLSHPVPFLQAKAQTEDTLRASGLCYTILAPHVFMDVWIPMVVGNALQENRPVLLIGSGERKHSFIAAADVAAFAVAALNNATALNRKISLGGPEPLSWGDIISIMEARLGRSIPVKRLPVGQAFTHLPDLVTGLLTGMEMRDVRIEMEQTAGEFGVMQTTLEQYIAHAYGGRDWPNE